MIYTTLNRIREHGPCTNGWRKLLAHLGKTQADNEPVSLRTILESNGLDDALWCLRAVDGYRKEMRLYAVWCARQVQHLLTDPRSLAALDVAERYAHGQATDDELFEARVAASEAASSAAGYAVSTEAWHAAWVAARAAASEAASSAAMVAAREAQIAEFVRVFEAASYAARDAAQEAQTAEFVRVFCQE